MLTRKQYINGDCNHIEYYSQFVTEGSKRLVKNSIGMNKLRATNGDLSKIDLATWDNIGLAAQSVNMLKDAGESYTLSVAVCINKETARHLLANDYTSTKLDSVVL